MSAFIVSNESINGIVQFMFRNQDGLLRPITNIDQVAQRKRLADRMMRMNQDAIVARYGADKLDTFTGGCKFEFVDSGTFSKAQTLCSLNCLLYQCSERNVDTTDLYRQLKSYRDDLAYDIAMNTPEYKEARWG